MSGAGDGLVPDAAAATASLGTSTGSAKSLLRSKNWQWWQLTTFMGQLNGSMSMLTLTTAGLYAAGSEAVGVQMAGIVSLSAGIAGPIEGRRLDRMDVRAGLQRSLVAAAAVLAGLTVAVAAHAPNEVLYALSVFEGLCVARVSSGQRALLAACAGEAQIRRAHFIASLVTEFGFVVGPLLVTLLAVVGGTFAALIGMTASLVVAAAGLYRVPRLPRRPVGRSAKRPGLWRARDARILVIFSFSIGLGFGMIERSVPLRMDQYGFQPSSAGLFMGVLALGSVLGGLYVSVRPIGSKNAMRTSAILFALFAVSVIPSAIAPTAVTFALALFVNSLMLVPLSGIGLAEVEVRLGADRRSEAFSYFMTSGRIGTGLAGTLGGILLGDLAPRHVPFISAGIFALTAVYLALVAVQSSRITDETGGASHA